MPNLEKGTEVARLACPDCGTKNTAKLDKNRRAYIYCHGEHPDGQSCNCRYHLSTATSQRMQAAYLAGRKTPKPEAQIPPSKKAETNGQSNGPITGVQEQPITAPSGGGFNPFDL